jgi:hypothetical protein
MLPESIIRGALIHCKNEKPLTERGFNFMVPRNLGDWNQFCYLNGLAVVVNTISNRV